MNPIDRKLNKYIVYPLVGEVCTSKDYDIIDFTTNSRSSCEKLCFYKVFISYLLWLVKTIKTYFFVQKINYKLRQALNNYTNYFSIKTSAICLCNIWLMLCVETNVIQRIQSERIRLVDLKSKRQNFGFKVGLKIIKNIYREDRIFKKMLRLANLLCCW